MDKTETIEAAETKATSNVASPARLFASLLAVLFTAEIVIMFTLPIFFPTPLGLVENVVDSILLVVLSAPFIWILIIRPLRKAVETEAMWANALLEHVVDGVIIFDGQGIIRTCNHATEVMFGYSAREVVGQHLSLLFHEAEVDCEHVVNFYGMSDSPDESCRISRDDLGRRKDSSSFPIDVSVSKVDLAGKSAFMGIIRDISRRKRAEEVLRESENRYHSLFENMLEGYAYCRLVFEQDRPLDFIYLNVNSAFERLTGLEDVVGRKVTELIPGIGESHPELFETYARVVLTGNPEKFEIYLEPLNVWLSVTAYSTEKECFAAVFVNISERKQAEEELNSRMHQAALSAEVGVALTTGDNLQSILLHSANAIVTHLDAAFARIWTLNERDNMLELQASAGMYTHINGPHGRVPVGKFKIGLIALEKKPHLTNAVVGDPRVGDQEWAKREGMVAFAGHPLIVADKLVGVMAMFSCKPLKETSLLALATISDQIALGIARIKASEALRESEEHFRLLVKHAPDAIFVQAGDCFSYVNRACLTLFGAEQEEQLLGMPVMERFHPDYHEVIFERIKTLNNERRSVPVLEVQYLRLDNTAVDVEVSAVPFTYQGEQGALVFSRDISERKQAERNLKGMQAQVIQQEKLASIGQLAAGVAHEINNPVGFISSNLGSLEKYVGKFEQFIAVMDNAIQHGCTNEARDEVAAGRRRFKIDYILQDIHQLIEESTEGTERVKKIVKDLKTFSHNGETEMVVADINACLESTINIVWNEIKYVATLQREYGNIPSVPCNPQQLNQVFLNLLVNASHAIEKQGEIIVRTWAADDSIHVSISDTGCGIPHADLKRIFDAFYTTKEIGKGTGLGLSISAEIVKKHKGEISVHSEVGKGSTFTVRIPVAID